VTPIVAGINQGYFSNGEGGGGKSLKKEKRKKKRRRRDGGRGRDVMRYLGYSGDSSFKMPKVGRGDRGPRLVLR